jgi:hypothetical protein
MKFIPGLELSERFYHEVVKELIDKYSASLRYSAGLLGYGSDVLGFDTETSTDHNWGPRLTLFLENEQLVPELGIHLRKNLPREFCGYSTNFSPKGADGTQRMTSASGNEINHLIEVRGLESYFCSALGRNLEAMANPDWLRVPEQILLEVTAGKVFHDGLGRLASYRERLSYYPSDVRTLRVAAYWDCIANEEAFLGRAIEMDDMTGLRLLIGRLVTWLMKICFAIRKRYCPYSKWLSLSFQDLGLTDIGKSIDKLLAFADAPSIAERMATLCLDVLRLQNESGDYPVVARTVQDYYGRPYEVIMAGDIVDQLRGSIEDERMRGLDLLPVALDGKVVSLDFTDSNIMERIIP